MVEAKLRVSIQFSKKLPNAKNMSQQALEITAQMARQEWIRIARQRLRTTAKTYVSSIGPVEISRGTATIRLRADSPGGWLANALEEGVPSYDLKKGLLKSSKVKRGKEGPYIHIPFKLGAPGGGARPPEPATMPRPIYRLASRLGMGKSLKLPLKYENYGVRTRLSPDLSKWGHYTWKTSPYQGITRTAGGGGRKSAYATFRTVSKNSDPSSWIHPGFRGVRAIEETAGKLDQIFSQAINELVNKES